MNTPQTATLEKNNSSANAITPIQKCVQTTLFGAVQGRGIHVRQEREEETLGVGGKGRRMDIMVIYVMRYDKFYGSEKLSWRARLLMGRKEGAAKGDGESGGRRQDFDGPGVEARRLDIESLRAPPARGKGHQRTSFMRRRRARGEGQMQGTASRSWSSAYCCRRSGCRTRCWASGARG